MTWTAGHSYYDTNIYIMIEVSVKDKSIYYITGLMRPEYANDCISVIVVALFCAYSIYHHKLISHVLNISLSLRKYGTYLLSTKFSYVRVGVLVTLNLLYIV